MRDRWEAETGPEDRGDGEEGFEEGLPEEEEEVLIHCCMCGSEINPETDTFTKPATTGFICEECMLADSPEGGFHDADDD